MLLPSNECEKARQFMSEVAALAAAYRLPVFAVTDRASITRVAHECKAVREARQSHILWEKAHGYDPCESW